MSDKIIISVTGDIDALLHQARQAAEAAGGKLAGDSKAGTLAGDTERSLDAVRRCDRFRMGWQGILNHGSLFMNNLKFVVGCLCVVLAASDWAAPAANTVAVPNLIGTDQASAATKLSALKLKAVVQQVNATKAPGTVLDQSERAGTQVAVGSTVTLKVAGVPLQGGGPVNAALGGMSTGSAMLQQQQLQSQMLQEEMQMNQARINQQLAKSDLETRKKIQAKMAQITVDMQKNLIKTRQEIHNAIEAALLGQ